MIFKTKKANVLLTFFFVFLLAPLFSFSQEVIEIQVAPNVLNLQNQGQVVTIHTDRAYSTVDASTVFLNGVEIESWKADNQGYFVAKFNMDEIQGLPELIVDEYNEFKLEGITYGGNPFVGYQDVLIIDRSAKKGR